MNRTFLIMAIAVMLVGCNPAGTHEPAAIDSEAAICFDVTADNGKVHLLLGQPGRMDKTVELYWKQSGDPKSQWSSLVWIPTEHAPAGNHHRGNDPQFAAHGQHLMALWTAKGGGPYGSGRIATALSLDGGLTWKAGPSPAASAGRDDVGYRFPATAADDKAFHVVWIHADDKERSLRYSRLEFGSAEWSTPVTIDSTACACCWNEMKAMDGKLFVLYRDEDPKDMAMAISPDGGGTWQQTGRAGAFDWKFEGCPHVGGGLAVASSGDKSGHAMLATVWTGETNVSGAYFLMSPNTGRAWSLPKALADTRENGRHTDAALISGSIAAVVWDEITEDEQSVWVSMTLDEGKTWTPRRLSASNTSARYPRVVSHGGQFIVFWSESGESEVLRVGSEAVSPPL
jgi:hypothetical protein